MENPKCEHDFIEWVGSELSGGRTLFECKKCGMRVREDFSVGDPVIEPMPGKEHPWRIVYLIQNPNNLTTMVTVKQLTPPSN